MEFLTTETRSLIAVQGPKAVKAVEEVSGVSLDKLYFMQTTVNDVAGVDGCRITRCGYTGEQLPLHRVQRNLNKQNYLFVFQT